MHPVSLEDAEEALLAADVRAAGIVAGRSCECKRTKQTNN